MADVTITQLNDLTPSANTYVPISNGITTGKAVYLGSGNPAGTVIMWSTNTPPAGYLECNGSAINRAAYASLFAVIGTTYGAGNGTTTFNLPDLRGEFIRGWDNGRGVDPGRSLGSNQSHELYIHSHGLADNTSSSQNDFFGGSTNNYGLAQFSTNNYGTTNTTGGAETRPRNVALMYCIKT